MDTYPSQSNLERYGHILLRYGLVIILISVGLLKFTAYETEGIQPLVSNSPFFETLNSLFGASTFSAILGVIEIVTGLMIAARPFSAKISAFGSMAAIVQFVLTLTLIFSTPGVWQSGYGFPFPSPMPGQFLLKDIILLGAAMWSAGEAWRAATAGSTALTGGGM